MNSRVTAVAGWGLKLLPLIPAALFLLGFLLIVMLYLVTLAFCGPGSAMDPEGAMAVLWRKDFRDALVNTFWFVVIGTPLELLTGLTIAMLLYRNFFLRPFFRSMFLLPLAIPALVTAMLLFILFDFPGGHVNHLLLGNYPPFPRLIDYPVAWRGSGLIAMGVAMLGKVWRDTPISMLILLAGLNSIDPELFDAAKTMGASFLRRFRHVVLPLLIPSISAVVLLRSVEMWKEFIFPFVLAGRYRLLGTLIDFYYNETGNAGNAAMVAIALVACSIISTLVFLWSMDALRKAVLRR